MLRDSAGLAGIPTILLPLRRTFGLTDGQGRMLAALVIRREMSVEALHAVVAGRLAEAPPGDLVKMVVFKLRQKIAPIEIETIRSAGYAISRASRDEIAGAIARFRAQEDLA